MDIGEKIPLNIDNIKNELVNPHIISKNIDPEGRDNLAKVIITAKEDSTSNNEGIKNNEQRIKEISNLTTVSYNQERQTVKELAERVDSLAVKLKNVFGINDKEKIDLENKINEIQLESNNLYKESFNLKNDLETLNKKQIEIPDPKQLLETYYEKISTTPISNEEKRNILKPEILANLSTEEYIALWRRLNPQFLAHITRQGFRDHTGGDVMVNHHGGYQEFVNGFVDVMNNGKKILPPLSRLGLINREDSTIKSFLSEMLGENTSKENAKDMFYKLLNSTMASAPKYPDITSTHFTAQIVADRYYGGESNNEVFFVYPSDILASQYNFAFNGWEKDFTRPQSETKWNDIFVWTDPNFPGVPVDSGIVFLPKNTAVDPNTGSQYAFEINNIDGVEHKVMVKNDALIDSFVNWGNNLDESPINNLFLTYKNEKNTNLRDNFKNECQNVMENELHNLGIDDVSSNIIAYKLIEMMYWDSPINDETLKDVIEESKASFKKAENTVLAIEYWEKFFENNPDLKPKHIHYYDGDPTNAIFEFQQQNNIGRADTSKVDGKLLGFDDMNILDMESDPRSNLEYDELILKANKIIDEYFDIK